MASKIETLPDGTKIHVYNGGERLEPKPVPTSIPFEGATLYYHCPNLYGGPRIKRSALVSADNFKVYDNSATVRCVGIIFDCPICKEKHEVFIPYL